MSENAPTAMEDRLCFVEPVWQAGVPKRGLLGDFAGAYPLFLVEIAVLILVFSNSVLTPVSFPLTFIRG